MCSRIKGLPRKLKWNSIISTSFVHGDAGGGDGIPAELFQILNNDAVKVLHSICQKIWKTQRWTQDWKRSIFIPIPKKATPKTEQTTVQLHSFHRLAE